MPASIGQTAYQQLLTFLSFPKTSKQPRQMSKAQISVSTAPANLTHQPAWDVREVIWNLYEGSYAYIAMRSLATMDVARRWHQMAPPARTMKLPRGDGTTHEVDMNIYLNLGLTEERLVTPMRNAWAVGALLTAADALKHYRYFDRAPCLELIYHLRNGVGHGNHFVFDGKALKRMQQYPAHNRDSIRGEHVHEITEALKGTEVLGTFMNTIDVQDCLQSAARHLERVAVGETTFKARAPLMV